MGVVGSLPSSISTISLNNNNNNNCDIRNEHSLPSSDENSNDTISVIPDINNNNSINSNIDNDYIEIDHHYLYHQKLSSNMTYESFGIKKNQLNTSTFETKQHCLKHKRLQNKKIFKRELQRQNFKQQLEKKVHDLELKQNILLSQIQTLDLYKQQLEIKCKHIISIID